MRFLRKTFNFSVPFIIVYAMMLIVLPLVPVHAQRPSQQIEVFDGTELGHRMDTIERLNLDRRVTILETIVQDAKDNSIWYKGSSVGTGILLLEAVFRFISKKEEDKKP